MLTLVLNEEQCESAPVVETNASSTQATLAVTITEAEAVAVALTVEDIEKTGTFSLQTDQSKNLMKLKNGLNTIKWII